jgi:hypothetical protein
MAKQSKPQKETMERVMHEFKHGELTTAAGTKVKSQRQAVAIGLSESGSSNQQSPAENKKRLKETKAKERAGQTSKQADEGNPTKAELYAQAKRKNIEGRSKMSKAELEKAVKG